MAESEMPPEIRALVEKIIARRERERIERTTIQLKRGTLKRLFQLKTDLRLRSYDEVISYLLDLYEKQQGVGRG